LTMSQLWLLLLVAGVVASDLDYLQEMVAQRCVFIEKCGVVCNAKGIHLLTNLLGFDCFLTIS
jgi:hypothetical protein